MVSLQGVRLVALRDKTALIFKANRCGAIASSDAIQNCRAGVGLLQDAHDLNQHKSQIFSYKPLPLYYEKNSILEDCPLGQEFPSSLIYAATFSISRIVNIVYLYGIFGDRSRFFFLYRRKFICIKLKLTTSSI